MALVWCATLPAQLSFRLDVGDSALEFGRPFELEVERGWPRDHWPQPFDERGLDGLQLRLLAADTREQDGRLIEVRRYAAVARRVGELVLGPFVLRTRDAQGREQARTFEVPPLTVASTLPDPPGAIEWPGDVRDRRRAWPWRVVLGCLAALLVLGFAGARAGRRRAVATSTDSGAKVPSPAAIARGELAALVAPPADAAAQLAFYVALAAIVRRYSSARYAVQAEVRTTEELVDAVASGQAALRDCLSACDLVKFAAARPGAPDHERARRAALQFVASGEEVG